MMPSVLQRAEAADEAEVVWWLKQHLVRDGFAGRPVSHILVDSDASYMNAAVARHLKPFGNLRIAGRRPDLVCIQESSPATDVLAFEVKASADRDYEKGIIQAHWYRNGATASYLCLPKPRTRLPERLISASKHVGIGLVVVSPSDLDIAVEPSPPLPDFHGIRATYRYLRGEEGMQDLRRLQLNRPLHYVAAAVATLRSGSPEAARLLLGESANKHGWGLGEGAVAHALTGAIMLGVLDRELNLTLRGRQYARLFDHLGFDFQHHRALTDKGKRLVRDAPAFAAALRPLFLEHTPTRLIVKTLLRLPGNAADIRSLAIRALEVDEGTALAVFGDPAEPEWLPSNATPFQLKAALYDIGIIDSKLARGANRVRGGLYRPESDVWKLGANLLPDAH